MITKRAAADRGGADHGWLRTAHTFSFADYFDPRWMGFGPLRVINQDVIAPGRGFDLHGHRNMEIVSWVLRGVLEHRDSMGNTSAIRPSEAQLMSAGTGVRHSEYNPSTTEPTELLQMWVEPAVRDTEPRYAQHAFPASERRGRLRLILSPDGADGSLEIRQNVRLYAGLLDAGDVAAQELPAGRSAWLHVGRGTVRLNGEPYRTGDGAAIRDEATIRLEGVDAADVVLFDLP